MTFFPIEVASFSQSCESNQNLTANTNNQNTQPNFDLNAQNTIENLKI
jgi:hypothetical protein